MNVTKEKIPCSISIITSKAEGLQACLEALKDFEEIVICHGNAPEKNLEVARAYGAKIVKQYDTDEPNVSSFMDKAAVRQRAMDASTSAWRFFMDRDDRLSPEAIEEIRNITSDPHPKHVVWRLRSRVFIAGRHIEHYGSYPAYQVRLVHESVGARFKGDVHERLVWDEKKFSVGTMQSFYDFNWSQDRVENYWSYWSAYITRELQTTTFPTLGNFLYWGVYRRTRTILGYLLWRLPSMYLIHGFKNSMPLSLELITVRYHVTLLLRSIALYIKTRTWFVILVETLKGKDLNRILSNIAVRNFEAYGRVLDIGGREGKSSYWRYLKHTRWYRTTTLDIDAAAKPDVVLDIEKESLPFASGHFDTALFFNVLEHMKDGNAVLSKIAGVLKPGGVLVGVIPFLVGVHPDPHDYTRYTNEGLEDVLTRAGFSHIKINTVGRGPLTASYYQSEFLWPRVLKLIMTPLVLLLDGIMLGLRPKLRSKFPLSYTFVAIR